MNIYTDLWLECIYLNTMINPRIHIAVRRNNSFVLLGSGRQGVAHTDRGSDTQLICAVQRQTKSFTYLFTVWNGRATVGATTSVNTARSQVCRQRMEPELELGSSQFSTGIVVVVVNP